MTRVIPVLLLLILTTIGCGNEESELTDKERATILLSKQWDIARVELNEIEITEFGYTSSKIQFNSNGTWTATNGGNIFSNAGNWSFTNDQFNVLDMSGSNVEISLNPQGLNMELRFTLTGTNPIGGRSTSLLGDYKVFLLPSYPN